jgi:hypothetical protein
MTGRTTVTVPDLVGRPVDVASEMAAAIGLLLSSEDLDGPRYPLAHMAGTLLGDCSGSSRWFGRGTGNSGASRVH